MENKVSSDIGEEIIFKLKEIITRLDTILTMKNEKELQNSSMAGIRT